MGKERNVIHLRKLSGSRTYCNREINRIRAISPIYADQATCKQCIDAWKRDEIRINMDNRQKRTGKTKIFDFI